MNRYNDRAPYDIRISAEIEIDPFICQMIGTVDSLLFKINDTFDLK
ncbi:MAG TPA: hypothetical protein VJ729_07515 [Nitrososphaeraceae archaeon]|nr:hypothetical protein [Nitrososphaeraceae archaeon]